MATQDEAPLSDKARLVFGAGIVFTAVVGVGLYYLAFPENRLEVPIGGAVLAGSVETHEAAEGDESAEGGEAGQAGGDTPDAEADA